MWFKVLLKGVKPHQRPVAQGGLWYTAKWLKVVEIQTVPQQRWRVAKGYLSDGTWWAYYVVKGEGQNPKKLDFDYHGAYILESAAKETAEELNNRTDLGAPLTRKYIDNGLGIRLVKIV